MSYPVKQRLSKPITVYEQLDQACRWEKQWMHERLSWLFGSQSILFAAYGLALRAPNPAASIADRFLLIVPLLGMLLSIIVFAAIMAAVRAYWVWTNKLFHYKYPDEETLPFLEQDGKWPRRLATIAAAVVPVGFFVAWFLVLIPWR